MTKTMKSENATFPADCANCTDELKTSGRQDTRGEMRRKIAPVKNKSCQGSTGMTERRNAARRFFNGRETSVADYVLDT